MKIHPGAIAQSLVDCSNALLDTIQHLRQAECTDIPLLITLSSTQAGIDTLATLFSYADDGHKPEPEQLEGKRINPPSMPAFIAEVEEDNPDLEDKDTKKAREESQGFFR